MILTLPYPPTANNLGHPRKFTGAEKALVAHYYQTTPYETFALASLSKAMSRPATSIARVAKQMGLTRRSRPKTENRRQAQARSMARKWAEQPHPRGFCGRTHSPDSREVISAASIAAWLHQKATGTGNMSPENLQKLSDRTSARMALQPAENAYSRTKSGRRADLGGLFVRSAWEANYARYLNWLLARGEIDGWEYEPETFWFEKIRRGVRSYKPDFRISEKGRTYYVEVKGWMDPKSKTKLARMKKYHPKVEIRLVDQRQYKSIKAAVSSLVPGWEV